MEYAKIAEGYVAPYVVSKNATKHSGRPAAPVTSYATSAGVAAFTAGALVLLNRYTSSLSLARQVALPLAASVSLIELANRKVSPSPVARDATNWRREVVSPALQAIQWVVFAGSLAQLRFVREMSSLGKTAAILGTTASLAGIVEGGSNQISKQTVKGFNKLVSCFKGNGEDE